MKFTYDLTVAIPTYNRADFLFRQLTDLCKQITRNSSIEILISDNCSEDSTRDVIEEFTKQYDFINYFRQEKNIGLDGNVLSCYENANGRYIWFLSDDDVIFDDAVQRVSQNIEELSPSVMAFSFVNLGFKSAYNQGINTYREYNDFTTRESIKDFFKVIMISALVLKKDNLDINYLKSCSPTIFPQITLALAILKNNFRFIACEASIVWREPGYITSNFFELYCINPRLAIKNAHMDQIIEKNLLKFTEKSLRDYVKLSILERIGYYHSKVGFPLRTLMLGFKEYKMNLLNIAIMVLCYMISKAPKIFILYMVITFKALKSFSLKKGLEYKRDLDLHVYSKIEKAKFSDV